jgi:hypothetical protein
MSLRRLFSVIVAWGIRVQDRVEQGDTFGAVSDPSIGQLTDIGVCPNEAAFQIVHC